MKIKEFIDKIKNTPPKKREIIRKLKPQSGFISEINGRIFIDHPFDLKLKKKYHFMGTIGWDSLLKKWELKKKNDQESCQFLLEINKEAPQYHWEISKSAYDILNKSILDRQSFINEAKNKLKIKKKTNNDMDFSFMKVQPFPFQKVGIEFIEANNGVAYIGDSMGLGKTMQSIGYTAKNNLFTVIVCPASLTYNWEREISKFTYKKCKVLSEYEIPDSSGLTTRAYNLILKKEIDNFDYDYLIINYEQLKKYSNLLKKIKFDCVVVDEAQNISNSKAQRTKIVFSLFAKIEKRILLSGTGIKNRPIEFYPQLKFLRNDIFSNKEKFGLRYCDAKENKWSKGFDYSGASNLRELNLKIAPFYLRRLKENVLKDLPEKTINLLDLEMDLSEEKTYNTILKDFKLLYSKGKQTFSFLASVVKIKQSLSKMKIQRIIEFTDELLKDDPNRKVILFSQFIDTQNALFDHYKEIAVSVFAKHNPKQKFENIEILTNDPSKKILVASSKAGGVGLNVTIADCVVFCDLLWNPADHEQAEDRSYRIGQKKKVNIYYMNYLNTIEEMLWKIIKGKEKILGEVLDGKESIEIINEKEIIKNLYKEFIKKLNLPDTVDIHTELESINLN